ncbi:penicillin-insensitive murein endopeptidase [Paraliomyxa miuraensis]|uniref:penicillin-insensitive murein endopeptidase n=1 Tax=Paraliomyxa miuraensis TaxID=376150 RepID=UPI002258D583|nr:penicillin-insensitive murein endopeptidase [Paraliomyxa miuraensis]MCX4242068.1 penicillin-insensitive murein endopeptidase [Paraliomyxa miuraensis]
MDRRDHDEVGDDDEHELDASDDSAAASASSDDEDAEDEDEDDEDDDADADDDDADDTHPGPSEAPPAKRRSLGPTLLVLGGGVWAIAMALRLGAPEPGPSLSVSTEPAPSAELSATPEPAITDRDPEPGTEDDDLVLDQEPDPEAASADRPVDDYDPPPPPPPEGWATDLDPPKKVTYTIRHGGSIKNVANLFKIFHHEITALNPSVALDQSLPPNSKVVVYVAEEGHESESVGIPSSGSLEGGVPMMEGPGRVLKMIPWKSWATEHAVTLLDQVLRRWAERGKDVQPVLVGNMAARKGGKLDPHSTHQSGRDVDIGYIQKLPPGEELNWREMNADNLDAAETWELLKLLRSTGQVEVIFIDTSIQKLLYEHAVKHGTVPKGELSRWLQYPKGSKALVQHVAGHVDHIHVRFACQPHERRCESRGL